MRLAFVDLETTGGSPVEDRITEVGIIEVDLESGGGVHPVREWSTLVNPDAPIPEFIETLTGISNAMVADAPRFEELADDILARLDGRLFIAHNARFDHGFLKNAFRRLDRPFRPPVLCTVRLSRKLYPGYARHNLDSLIERHRLIVDRRHRALDDARLLWQLWQKLHDALPAEQITAAIDQLTARPSLPRHLDPDILDTLPKTAGVYLFHGSVDANTTEAKPSPRVEEPRPLYIGKAKNLRQRVMAHFTGDHLSAREMELSQQMTRVEWIETGGGTQHDLGALLTEATMVKARMPAYNRQLRKSEDVCAWRLLIDRVIDDGIDREIDRGVGHGIDREVDHGIGHGVDRGPGHGVDRVIGDGIDRGVDRGVDHGIDRGIRDGAVHGVDRGPVHGVDRAIGDGIDPAVDPGIHRAAERKPTRRSRPVWRLALARPDDLFFAQDPDLYGPFATPRQAGVTLRAIADAHGLCPALLKLDKTPAGKPCFSHQVKRCRGACIGLETVAEHARRLQAALASLALVPWPFAGPIAFREGRVLHVVDGWAYLGMAADLDHARDLAVTQRLFDHDIYRLLVKRIDALEIVRW